MMIETHEGATFSGSREQEAFARDYMAGNWVSRTDGGAIRAFVFNTDEFPLSDHVWTVLTSAGIVTDEGRSRVDGRLERLHEIVSPEQQALDAHELNAASKACYELGSDWQAVYRSFVENVVVGEVLGVDSLYQRTATIRVHFPRQQGFNWHPRFHTDIMLGHPPQEVNVWVPLTTAFGTNSMYLCALGPSLELVRQANFEVGRLPALIQSDEAVRRSCFAAGEPVHLTYGEFVVFDSRCLHATQFNDTDTTRVSMDIRVLPLEDFQRMTLEYSGTGRRRVRFTRGEYYDSEIIRADARR